ncbi:MAG: PIN domain-containing protein [Candidatus Bathyarchaeia archaeon]
MFPIETDLIYAIMKREDPLKDKAKQILKRSKRLHCSSATIIEILSVLKAVNKFASVAPKLKAFGNLKNLIFLPITPDVANRAVEIHSAGLLTFFDSFYAATALTSDMTLISSDKAFKNIPNLKFMSVEEYLSEVLKV